MTVEIISRPSVSKNAYQNLPNLADSPDEGKSAPGYDAALRTAAEAFALLGQFSAPPIPKAYEISFAYAIGKPPECKERVDDAVSKDGLLTLHEVYEIHGDLFSYPDKVRQQQFQTTDDLDSEMNAVLSMVKAHQRTNNAYSQSLESAADGLRTDISADALKSVIQGLIVETRRARSRADELSESLEASRATIVAMRGKLAKAREAGLRDPLTKLFNRRYMDETLPEVMDKAWSEDQPVCVVLVDIDHFKQINDTFGHPAGDAVLRIVGALLADNLKGRDIAVRYGGEEFALILPDTDTAGALSLSNKIRSVLERKKLILRESNLGTVEIHREFNTAPAA